MRFVDVEQLPDLAEQGVRLTAQGGLAGGEQEVVGQHSDDQASLFDGGLHGGAEAVRLRVCIQLVLDLGELAALVLGRAFLVGGGRLGRAGAWAGAGGAVLECAGALGLDRLQGLKFEGGRYVAGVGGRALLGDRLAARQDVAGEGRLQGLLQGLVLGDVDRGDREQDHEQGHQQRDHVGVGEQPALLALLAVSPASMAPAPTSHDQAA